MDKINQAVMMDKEDGETDPEKADAEKEFEAMPSASENNSSQV